MKRDRMSRGELRDEIDSLEMRLDESRRALVRALFDASEARMGQDAAVAAERERCLKWVQSSTCSCGEPGCDGPHFDERFCRVHNGIRSGAPAPGEG